MKYNKGNVVTINISVWVKHTSKEIKGRDVINLQPRSRVILSKYNSSEDILLRIFSKLLRYCLKRKSANLINLIGLENITILSHQYLYKLCS